MKALRTIALLGRRPGLSVLTGALIGNPLIELVTVYTHARLPKAEGGSVRPELVRYQQACAEAGVSLQTLDFPEARNIDTYIRQGERIDLLLALSWRFVVPEPALQKLRVGGLNIHRGALPLYAGSEPVRRAIEARERRVAITAHWMTPEIDAGAPVAVVWLDIDPPAPGADPWKCAEQVKRRMEPLYAPLAQTAIAAVAV